GGDGLASGTLSVDGKILARSGDVVLIAPNVQVGTGALVQSPSGATILAAGQKVELTGRGLEGIRMELQAPGDQALNLGTLQGDAVGIFAGQLKHSGLIQANAVTAEGGKVVLKAGAGDALVDGRISAVAGSQGGSIDVLGQRVGLLAGAALDVSGERGGGSVRVGGDYQGKNAEVPNAQRTYVDAAATIKADAGVDGNGGRVIVWADDQTQSFGAIGARGGAQGGDGGFVEVSGKHRLQFSSPVDTRAPMGKTGILLLDPDDIVVSTSGGVYGGDVLFGDAPTFLTLDVATINSANSNVVLQANNQIDIDAPINIANAGIGFTAQAGGYLNVNGSITTNGGAVSLTAGDPGSLTSPNEGSLNIQQAITTNGGNITLLSNLSDVGGNSVFINAPINAGTGAVGISGQRVDVTSAGISGGSITMSTIVSNGHIDLNGATLAAGGGGILLSTTGADADVYLLNSTLIASAGSSIQVGANAGTVDVWGSTLNSDGGSVNVSGASAGTTGVSLYNSTVNAGSGDISIVGTTQNQFSFGVEVSGSMNLSAGAGTAIFGENQATSLSFSGGGILVDCGCMGSLTGSGTLSLTGVSAGNGIGIEFSNADISRSGPITINGNSAGIGVLAYGSNFVTNGDTLNINGSHVDIEFTAIDTGGAALAIGSSGGVYIYGSSIGTSGGSIDINGGSASLFGTTGVYIGSSSIHAGAGAVNITGESADLEGFVLDAGGATVSGSTVAITGTTGVGSPYDALQVNNELISATSAIQLTAVNGLLALNNSTVENSGSGQTVLQAVTTAPAPIPGIYIDGGSSVRNVGASPGEIHLVADYLDLQGQIDSGAARTMIKPTRMSRAIGLGSTDDSGKLALSQAELGNVTAGVIVIGGGSYTGGLSIESSIGVGSGALSLIQGSAASITQAGGATIYANQLNADAGSVVLTEANHVSVISGRATNASGAGFAFSNDGGADLTVGAVDGILGIHSGTGPTGRSAVALSANNGSIWQFEAVRGSSLTAAAGVNINLTNPGNDLTAIDATAVAGDAALTNNAPAARLNASAGGTVAYRGFGALTVGTIAAGGSVALEADAIAAEAGKGTVHALNDGQVFVRAANGAIGSGASPLRVATSGGVFAQALGTGGNVHLSTPSTSFKLHLDAAGLASITGPGAGSTLGLASAKVGGALSWSGFDSAVLGTSVPSTTLVSVDGRVLSVALEGTTSGSSLGSSGGGVSAGGPITAEGDVYLAGVLAPGGSGGISSMTVSGNLHVLDGAVMEFDFNGTSHDKIDVAGNVVFPSAPGGSTLIAKATSQPADGSYKLIAGTTSGELPTVTGNVAGASLAYGSLMMNVATAPPPAPAPLTGSTTDQVAALIDGNHALAAQVVAENNTLTTFTSLLQQEEEKQAADAKGLDNLVDDNQCRR
ncbi:beta strand repeat-containing protein, partial [Caenimonas soli]|uniref:beta strand repeat-containing protein n=1 Tax=Caenimonas soli TaxID=2735555 RepID=UPI0015543C2A|nr:hypothetical protein [Caenimonas soli]